MNTNPQVSTNSEPHTVNSDPPRPLTNRRIALAGQRREHTVLVVDDTSDNQELLRTIFRSAGYEVLTAGDGSEGFEVAGRERPDLVISDVLMPGVDGVTLCRLIRSDAELSTTPLLLVSALRKDTETVLKGLEAGADDYLESPCDPLRLIAKAARLIEMGSAANALRESEKRFRLMAEAAPVMLWMSDLNKRRTYANKSWLEFTGRTLEEELGDGWTERLHQHDLQRCLEIYNSAFAARREFRMEYRIQRFDGEYRWVIDTGVPRFMADHSLAGYIGSCIDITERKQAEEQISNLNDELERRVTARTAELRAANDELENEVAKRGLTEQALSESDNRFRAFMDNTPAIAFVKHEDGRYVYANRLFEQLRMADWRGRTDLDMWPEEIARQMAENDQIVLATGQTVEREETIPGPEGSDLHWWTYRFPLTDSAGRGYIAGVAVDITARKRAEDVLSASEARLTGILDIAEDGIISMDQDHLINLFNQGAERIFGYTAAEVLGQPLDMILPVGYQGVHRQHARGFARSRHTAQKTGENIEVFGRRKDGTKFPAEVSISKLMPGKDVFYTAIVRDVTERKLVEETLRASEENYRDLVEGARDIIYTSDLSGRFTSLNRAGEQLTGYSREEAVTLNFADIVAPDYLDLAREMLARKIAGQPATVYELDIVTRDFHRLTLEINSRAIYRDGEAVGTQGVARDITERKQLEEQLRQSQKMESVGRLAGGVAHDFNNLLTVITGYSEMLLKSFEDDEGVSWKVEEIRKAGKRASALTYQLLAFSRKQVLQPKLLDINATVNDVGKMLQRLIGEDIELVMVLHPAIGQIKADPGQISQIIMNLAVNARDAMPRGGKLSIETANIHLDEEFVRHHLGAKPGPYVMLALVDTGIGMDADIQKQIFEPFFTTKETGSGSGLGLATVYGIVKQSGGYITVESEVGQGSTFRIYLPLVDGEDEGETAWSEAANGEMPQGTEKILLVEDEQAVRALSRQILEMCGYQVLEARDGVEAVSICNLDCEIDLLVTDVVMPQMSGGELAEHLSMSRPEMRVLYMSGYTDDAIVRHGLGDGSANFIQKPFTPDTLAQKVREVLDAPQRC